MQELPDSDVGVTACNNRKWIAEVQLGIFEKMAWLFSKSGMIIFGNWYGYGIKSIGRILHELGRLMVISRIRVIIFWHVSLAEN